jgi:hypothetical protein
MLRLKSRYLVDGAAIGSEEFLRRLTGGRLKTAALQDSRQKRDKTIVQAVDGQDASDMSDASASMPSPGKPAGKPGVAMRFGQWGGLRVLRDLRVAVVG